MKDRAGTAYGLGAAALFGLSAPLAKLLLPGVGPWMLAGILYLGAGVGLSAWRLVSRASRKEAKLVRGDLPWLLALIVLGGMVGPVAMLFGLSRLSAASGALLLNLEAPFTILLAVLFFGEHLGKREGLAAAVVVLGAMTVGLDTAGLHGSLFGVLAIALACLCWGLDNNLTQRLSLRDPLTLAQVKTLSAGGANVVLATVAREAWPSAPVSAAAVAVGFVCYGISIVLDVQALRRLGAAREAALFAAAPFFGAAAALVAFHERPAPLELAGMAVLVLGVVLLVRARHAHLHSHEGLEHEHLHTHDAHHQHRHPDGIAPAEPHTHPHRHSGLTHDHAHVADAHHRHGH